MSKEIPFKLPPAELALPKPSTPLERALFKHVEHTEWNFNPPLKAYVSVVRCFVRGKGPFGPVDITTMESVSEPVTRELALNVEFPGARATKLWKKGSVGQLEKEKTREVYRAVVKLGGALAHLEQIAKEQHVTLEVVEKPRA
jgi:hypothetical protein